MIFKNRKEIDMVNGKLFKNILLFYLPIMVSSVLQLLYNAADLIVCGKFGSNHSVAAISSTNSLVNLIVTLFMGLSVGANVLMSRYVGAKDDRKCLEVVHSSIMLSLIFGGIVAVFGATFSRVFLVWMGSPAEVLPLSTQYMVVYFLGVPALMIYNFGAALLRAAGDSQRPFYFLAISGLINVLLNLLFVIGFKLDVIGVAIATVISQSISATLIVIALVKHKGVCKLTLRNLKLYKSATLGIIRIGLPAGVQGAIFSISNVIIQSNINSLGPVAMDGSGASQSIEGFVYVIMNSVSQATVSFVSANYGAKRWDNIKKVIIYSLILVFVFGLATGLLEIVVGKSLLRIYLSDEEAVKVGYERLIVVGLTYFLCGVMDDLTNAMRGLGYVIGPTIATLVFVCGIRLFWVYTFFPMERFHSLQGLIIAWPLSWLVTVMIHSVTLIIVYRKENKKHNEEIAFYNHGLS